MVEILSFKKRAGFVILNAMVTNLNVCRLLMSYCGRDKNIEYIHVTG
jgi:hypothetical protein